MTGTDSDNDITLNDLLKKTHSTVAKANAAAAPSTPSANMATACASSAKAIMDRDDVTLATLDDLKRKATKKDSDDLFDTDNNISKKKLTKEKRCPVDSDNPGH